MGSFPVAGRCVGVDHGDGVSTVYYHLDRAWVRFGARVRGGQVIGAVGSTGASAAPHLHWGMLVGGVPVDPLPFLGSGGPYEAAANRPEIAL